MNIRARLLLLVLVVWLPAVAGFGLLARATYVRETDAARAHVHQLAQSLNSLVERELDKRAVMARTLGASTALKNADLHAFYDEAVIAAQGSQSWVILEDANTQLLNTRVAFDPRFALSRAKGAPLVLAPIIFFTDRGPVSKAPLIEVLAPELAFAPLRFNIGICFEPAVIQSILDQTVLPEGSTAAVVDSQFRVMARNRDPAKWLGQIPPKLDVERIRAAGDGFAQATTLDGIPSQVYRSKPNHYDWVSVIAIPLSAFAAAARRITVQAFAASGVLLLIGLVWAFYAARRISEPMLALRAAANKLALDAVPPRLATGVQEADEVSVALHLAGLRSQEATTTLERRVADAVVEARDAQAKLLDGQKHEAIGRLAGGIAHDFNNLLQTISVGLQVIELTATEGQTRVLEHSRRATAKAAELVRQMLTFGRAAPLVPQTIYFADFILGVHELASKAVGARIRLTAAVEAHLPAVFVDPIQLELALLNLVFNARDAMPQGGSIQITAKVASSQEASAPRPADFVRIDVCDDGQGMDAHALSRALEPYFTTKPIGAGSGLGLPQVDAFARQSGGEVRIASTPGTGTRVSLYLPSCADTSRPALSEVERVEISPLKILMVEDDVLVSAVVVRALEGAGHAVTLCDRADNAVAVLSSGAHFDVVFTDVVMPGKMTGLDLASWCASHIPSTGVVVATGYTSQQIGTAAQILKKPYDMGTLFRALDVASKSRSVLRT